MVEAGAGARWIDGYDHLRAEDRGDGIALVTLALPERRNMMSAAMTASWTRLMAALRTDRDLRCVVVTGEGSAFCSGGDTEWITSEPDAPVEQLPGADVALLPGVAGHSRPRGADHRRR
jgi:enoyl-CoA hydratase/carnithine racemase